MENKAARIITVIAVSVFLLGSGMISATQAATFKYVDKNGVTHFTDRFETIPKEYRHQIQTIRETVRPESPGTPAADEEKKEAGKVQPGEAAVPDSVKKEAAEKALQEKAEQERKQKDFDEKVKRIEDLKKEIASREEELKSLRTTWMVFDRQAVFRLNQEIADLRKEIEEIQRELAEQK